MLSHRFWSVVTGVDIPVYSDIEGGLLLTQAKGVFIQPYSHMGPNCRSTSDWISAFSRLRLL